MPALAKVPSAVHAAEVKGQRGSSQALPSSCWAPSAGLGCTAPRPHSEGSPRASAGKPDRHVAPLLTPAVGPTRGNRTQRPPCGPQASRAWPGLWPPVLPRPLAGPTSSGSRHFLRALAPAVGMLDPGPARLTPRFLS